MKNINKNKFLTLLLSFIMVIGTLPVGVYADENEQTPVVLPDACITVPCDAQLFVGSKGVTHFVKFTEIKPDLSVIDDENNVIKYYFELDNQKQYNYRVSGDNYVTYGGIFTKEENFNLEISEENLKPQDKNKNTIDRNTESNNGCNVADIYLNINPKGYLKLSEGETYQIVNLRNWEATNSITENYFMEPDYSYEVIDENGNESDVVEIDESGVLTARRSGTVIVLVTYDAMILNYDNAFGGFYGAIWPENTGVFVVSVDSEDSNIETGMTINKGSNNSELKLSGDKIDSEHDCIYYLGDKGEYSFTPETEGVSVSVANPVVHEKMSFNGFEDVEKNTDGSFTVPLLTGRNIVKLTKDGKEEYQVITAKHVNVTINNGEEVHPGDSINIKFDTLYHPANKLAGVYNMSAVPIYEDVYGYEGKLIGGSDSQYSFASNNDCQTISNEINFEMRNNGWFTSEVMTKQEALTVPEDYPYDTFTLKDGKFRINGFGDSYGNHRFISYETGKAPNFNASTKLAFLGKLPDIAIPIVATTSSLSDITLETENVKTEYFDGDKFDTTNLVVTANYEDGTTQIATNYTVTPQILTKNTEEVTVTYSGKTAKIPVTVNEAKVSAIKVINSPSKTTYEADETFNPAGMVIHAVYNNGTQTPTSDYLYAPVNGLKTTDKEIKITYTGADAAADVLSVTLPITVTEKTINNWTSSPSGSGTVTPGNEEDNKKDDNKEDDKKENEAVLSVSFGDVPKTHWAHTHITNLANKGILLGKEDGFAPEDNITRAEFVTVLARMSGEDLKDLTQTFNDVGTEDWYAKNVSWALRAGITSGISKTEFAPNAKITRQDMAVMLVRFAEYMQQDLKSKFDTFNFGDEESISDYAKNAVQIMQNVGIISGRDNGNFAPTENATRAEAAKMLDMLLEIMESEAK